MGDKGATEKADLLFEALEKERAEKKRTERDRALQRKQAVSAIERELGFEDPADLVRFVLDRLSLFQEAHQNYERPDLLTNIAQALREPARAFRFDVEFLARPHFDLNLSIGGPYELALRTIASYDFSTQGEEVSPAIEAPDQEPADERKRMSEALLSQVSRDLRKAHVVEIERVVLAATAESAAIQIERLLDELLGALRSLGLLVFTEGRNSAYRTRSNQSIVSPVIHFADSPQAQTFLASIFADRLCGSMLREPTDYDALEMRRADRLERRLRFLRQCFALDSPRARQLRAACRLAFNSEHAGDLGATFVLAFAVIEGLLLPANESRDRLVSLKEAVAHSVGESFDRKAGLREQVDDLYKLRSGFVHAGNAGQQAGKMEEKKGLPILRRSEMLQFMDQVLKKEIEQLGAEAEQAKASNRGRKPSRRWLNRPCRSPKLDRGR